MGCQLVIIEGNFLGIKTIVEPRMLLEVSIDAELSA